MRPKFITVVPEFLMYSLILSSCSQGLLVVKSLRVGLSILPIIKVLCYHLLRKKTPKKNYFFSVIFKNAKCYILNIFAWE